MKEYTIESPDLDSNTLKCYKAENLEELEEELQADGIDCYNIVSQSEVNQ